MIRSSTSDQPTAIRPGAAASNPSSVMPRTMTTVDAVARHMPSTAAPPTGPTEREPEPGAERDHDATGEQGAGHRQPAHRPQIGEREPEADAEHQQHDADVGELRGERGVADKPRRVRADRDAGQQIAEQRRLTQALGERAEGGGGDERDRDGRGPGHGPSVTDHGE